MTNPDGPAGETPPSGTPSEPSSGGYEAPPIEQSADRPQIGDTPSPDEPPPPYEMPPAYDAGPAYPPVNYPDYPQPPSDYPQYPPPYGAAPPQQQQFPAAPGYPPPGYPGMPGYNMPGGYSAGGYPTGYGLSAAPTTNGMAIGSLVASGGGVLFFFFCFTGIVPAIVGIVLGIIALNQIRTTGQGGRGLAISGIALGAAVTLVTILFFIAVGLSM
ncbi:DUF4190 domain-containing protein [Mycolicibacterium sp. XJ870]